MENITSSKTASATDKSDKKRKYKEFNSKIKYLIKKEEFEKLCFLQCTQQEIASFFDVNVDTINAFCKKEYGENFSVVFQQKKGKGLISLRRALFQQAQTNPTSAIFLSKNYLGLKDKVEVEEPKSNELLTSLIDVLKSKETTEQ